MARWYCDGCVPNRHIGDVACGECCGWVPDPTPTEDDA